MMALLTSNRHRNALKIALAACLSVYAGLAAHIPNPFWIGTVAVLSLSVNAETTWQRSIERVIGTLLGAGIALLILHFFINAHLILLLSIFILVFIAVFGFLSQGGTWLNLGITAYFVILLSISAPEASASMAVWRGIAILLGIIITLIVDHLLFVETAKQQLDRQLSTIKQHLSQALLNNSDLAPLKQQLQSLQQLCLAHASGLSSNNRWQYQQLANKFDALFSAMNYMHTQSQSLERSHLLAQQQTLLQHISQLLLQLGNDDWLALLDDSRKKLDQLISDQDTLDLKRYWVSVDNLLSTLAEIHSLCRADGRSDPARGQSSFSQLLQHFRTRPDWIVHASKVALASIIVIYIWLYSHWYGGICAGISVIAIGADDNMNKVHLKAWLRFAGSICGILMSVFFVIFIIRDIYSLLLMVFLGSLYLGYLAGGNFKQMYFAWMASMAYIITVIPNITMQTSIAFTLERAAGLILGWLVIYVMMNVLWPAQTETFSRKKQAQLIHQIADAWRMLAQLHHSKTLQHELIQHKKTLIALVNILNPLCGKQDNDPIWQQSQQNVHRFTHCVSHLGDDAIAWLQANTDDQFRTSCLAVADATEQFGTCYLRQHDMATAQYALQQAHQQFNIQCEQLNQQRQQQSLPLLLDCYLSSIVDDWWQMAPVSG